MQRTYLALAGAGLIGAAALAAGVGLISAPSRAWAQSWAPRPTLFDAQPVDPRRYAVLGRPLGNGEWNLLVLEQILPGQPCWQQRPDGLVDPSLNRFDYTGICGRYLDSNGYSLRLANREGPALGGGALRLRLQQSGAELQLLATAPELARELLVGRAPIPSRDRSGFVALRLAPGWELQRRSYQGQALNHLYFAHPSSAEQLVAAAGLEGGPSPAGRRTLALLPPPPPPVAPVAPAWNGSRSERSPERVSQRRGWSARPLAAPQPQEPWLGAAPRQSPQTGDGGQGRTIALQVIPFRE
jgi:hypothetical protein